MTSNTNNKSDQSETLAQLYECLLYLGKDIIAIKEKLGINNRATIIHQSKTEKTLIHTSCFYIWWRI